MDIETKQSHAPNTPHTAHPHRGRGAAGGPTAGRGQPGQLLGPADKGRAGERRRHVDEFGDVGMEALQDDFASRAAGVVGAGCDAALHCSGKMDEMIAVASAVPSLGPEGEARLDRAMAGTRMGADEFDFAQEIAKRDLLLAQA